MAGLMALLAAQRARRTVGEATLKMGPEADAGPSAASEVKAPLQAASEVEAPPEAQNTPPEERKNEADEGGVDDSPSGSNARTVNFYFLFKIHKKINK